jgi:exonuclease VII small subunit
MTNLTKLVLGLATVGLVAWLALFFSMNSRLNEAIGALEHAQAKLDTGLSTLTAARQAVDSVRSDLQRFSSYVKDIQTRVEILDLNERAGNKRFRNQKDVILQRLRELYKDVEATGRELPEIPVIGGGG